MNSTQNLKMLLLQRKTTTNSNLGDKARDEKDMSERSHESGSWCNQFHSERASGNRRSSTDGR